MLHGLIRCSRIYEPLMSPALNGSSAIQGFERGDAIEIRDGIIFDCYMGLSQLCLKNGYFEPKNVCAFLN